MRDAIDLVALREKAERNGQVDIEDGPVWELPSWATVRTLLDEIERLEGVRERHEYDRSMQFPIATALSIYLPKLWRRLRGES